MNVDETATNQPHLGTAFTSHGHYGSTIFDPMDGHYIEINVCDLCLGLHSERVYEGRDYRLVIEDGSVTGTEPLRPPLRLTRWHVPKQDFRWVLEQAVEEGLLEPGEARTEEQDD